MQVVGLSRSVPGCEQLPGSGRHRAARSGRWTGSDLYERTILHHQGEASLVNVGSLSDWKTIPPLHFTGPSSACTRWFTSALMAKLRAARVGRHAGTRRARPPLVPNYVKATEPEMGVATQAERRGDGLGELHSESISYRRRLTFACPIEVEPPILPLVLDRTR